MKKVIILNAPPNSGKDVVAEYLSSTYDYGHVEFKAKLIELTKSIYCISDSTWNSLYTREFKDTSSSEFYGLTPREALIYTSEKVIKPAYGLDYFGKSLAKEIKMSPKEIHIVSDGGFKEELDVIVDEFGNENVMVIRIHRPNCTFDGDSRKYFGYIPGVVSIDVHNDKDLDYFYRSISAVIAEFIQGTSVIH